MRPLTLARNGALALLALLAVALGANLYVSASRFTTAYDVYDQLGLELERFDYVDPTTPIATTLRITNPSGNDIELIAIELRLNAGVRRVGGGETRPVQPFPAGASEAFDVSLQIDDDDYVTRLGDGPIDWRVTGRVQVRLAESIDPVWIPFVVRYLPQ